MKCMVCGSNMILRKNSEKEFWGCSNYPSCKYSISNQKNVEKAVNDLKEQNEKLTHKSLGKNCNGNMVLKINRIGDFYGECNVCGGNMSCEFINKKYRFVPMFMPRGDAGDEREWQSSI